MLLWNWTFQPKLRGEAGCEHANRFYTHLRFTYVIFMAFRHRDFFMGSGDVWYLRTR